MIGISPLSLARLAFTRLRQLILDPVGREATTGGMRPTMEPKSHDERWSWSTALTWCKVVQSHKPVAVDDVGVVEEGEGLGGGGGGGAGDAPLTQAFP